ncbi:3462_t:CDS:2 [Diversispora eburnea]|uniref:Lysophospholipase n=1 Tax=Diversispora eburnea TaxID=1213867 RepID=A0A9N9CAK1_9GLOM|nr:3462_t:CDS:2 [Diversispora eburnea]
MTEPTSENPDTTENPETHSWFGQIKEAIEHVAESFQSAKIDENVVKAFDDLDDRVIEKLKDTTLYPELEWDATVRISNDLCEEEKKFIHDRKLFIREAFAKYVGVDVSEIHVDDIPVITFMGSGGGFRAMIAVTAYLKALQDSGLYDCGVYLTGLSGSCWNMAQLYSTIAQSHENPIQALLDFYRTQLTHNIVNARGVLKGLSETSDTKTAVELVFGSLIQKKATGVKLSIMDVYGALLAAKLMIDKDPTKQFGDFKLSEQRKYIDGGKNLMPLYVATSHIRPWKDALETKEAALIPNYEELFEIHKKKKDYYQWYEFNPYEIGTWIPSWAFGRKFEFGKTVERFPEQNFGLLIGLMGAAPAAPLISDITQIQLFLPAGNFKDQFKNLYDEAMERIGTQKQQEFEGHHPIPQPHNYNFSYHLHPSPPYPLGLTNNEIIDLIDSGVSNDFPMYPITHPNRKIDVVIGFDCSSVIIDHKFFDDEQDFFCKRRGFNRVTRDVTNKYCEIYDYIPTGETDDEFLPPAQKQFVLCYMQYFPNDKVDPSFVPSKAKFAAFNNFVYTTAQVDLMIRLAKENWLESEKQVKEIIIDTWKKKRDARLNGTNFP